MKLTKIAGAFALTAAMAMAAVPAFAAPIDATNEDLFTESGTNKATATTKVMATATNVDLNATIPTQVAVVIPSKGVGTVQCPSSSVYKIVNKSTGKIYLNSISATGGFFTLTTDASSAPATGQVLAMKLDAGSKTGNQLTTTPINFAAGSGAEIAVNGELPLTLSGNVAMASGVTLTTANLDAAIMSITYTISTVA